MGRCENPGTNAGTIRRMASKTALGRDHCLVGGFWPGSPTTERKDVAEVVGVQRAAVGAQSRSDSELGRKEGEQALWFGGGRQESDGWIIIDEICGVLRGSMASTLKLRVREGWHRRQARQDAEHRMRQRGQDGARAGGKTKVDKAKTMRRND